MVGLGGRLLVPLALVLAACAPASETAARSHVAEPFSGGQATSTPSVALRGADLQREARAAQATPYAKLRVFVASESTDQVWVLEGGREFAVVGRIGVGRMPHQLSVSPNGRWIAVNNRMSNSTSVIDPVAVKEIVRLPVGKQPHAIIWSPDSSVLFVGHERDPYIARFEAGTWKPLPPIFVGVPQHVLTLSSARPRELYFTLTNTNAADHIRAIDLVSGRVTAIKVQDVHDAYFTPDASEIWSTSSGFIGKPSDRIVITDPEAKAPKEEIHLGPGRYPFHTMKENQDGMYFMSDSGIMVIADHNGPALLWVDWRARKIVGETKLGQQPFHTTFDPLGDRLLTTTNVDGMVNVIDVRTRQVLQKVPVPKPHGIAAVGVS